MDSNTPDFWKSIDRRKTPHEYEVFLRVKELLVEFTEQERLMLHEIKKELQDQRKEIELLASQQKLIMDMYTQSKGVVRFLGWMAIIVSMAAAAIDYLASHIRFLKP